MLLLSSATRIFATEGPPGTWTPRPAPVSPHTVPPSYWSTATKVRQRRRISRVSEVDTSERPVRNCLSGCDLPAASGHHQGMIFLIPFFFLLVDSLPLSLVAGCAASVFAASAAGVFAAADAFGSAAAAVGGAAAFGSGSVVAGCASVAGASTVDPPAAPLPGVATSMTAVLPAGLEPPAPAIRACPPPPVRTSLREPDSVSGCSGGGPFRAATTISFPGPVFTSESGLLSIPGLGLTAFCSACIHANAFGSGCGTGTAKPTSLFFASPAKGDN